MKEINKREENIFDRVEQDKLFHVHKGPIIYNLRALIDYLPGMTDAQFKYHVHGSVNDFESWIRDVFGSGTVVNLIGSASTKEELLRVLKRKCSEYDQRIQNKLENLEEGTKNAVKQAFTEVVTKARAGEMEDYSSRNERMADKFDEIANSIDDALADTMPQELVDLADDLASRYDELRMRTSELRKLGKDVLIPALHLRQFKSKLSIADSTRERADYEHVQILLKQVEMELDEAERQEEINVKKEVLRMAGLEEKDEEQLKTTT